MNRFQPYWGHLSRQHLSWRPLSISGLSQLLLTRFWPKFKCRFLGTSSTNANCHGNICSGNICPGNIYPKFFLTQNLLGRKTFLDLHFWTQICLNPKCFVPKNFLDPNFFWTQNCCGPQNFFGQKNFFDPNSFRPKIFFDTKSYFIQKFLDNKYFWTQNIS